MSSQPVWWHSCPRAGVNPNPNPLQQGPGTRLSMGHLAPVPTHASVFTGPVSATREATGSSRGDTALLFRSFWGRTWPGSGGSTCPVGGRGRSLGECARPVWEGEGTWRGRGGGGELKPELWAAHGRCWQLTGIPHSPTPSGEHCSLGCACCPHLGCQRTAAGAPFRHVHAWP